MPRLFTLALTLVLAGWMTTAALAADKADKKKKDPEQRFAKLDANNDKKLSLDEFKGKRDAAKAEKGFKRLDKDGDGSLSLEEFKAAGKKKKAK